MEKKIYSVTTSKKNLYGTKESNLTTYYSSKKKMFDGIETVIIADTYYIEDDIVKSDTNSCEDLLQELAIADKQQISHYFSRKLANGSYLSISTSSDILY